MASVGIDEVTGEAITGWDRIRQDLFICIRTEIGERVQRRDFGGGVPSLVDRAQNQMAITNLFAAVNAAIEPRFVDGFWYGEPCFGLRIIRANLTVPAKPVLELVGVEYPNGHNGDFKTIGRQGTIAIPLENVL